MSFRKDVGDFATILKGENGYSYSDLESITGMTRKQISAVLNGKDGVSLSKIEEFFNKAFSVELSCAIGQKIDDLG